MSATRSDPVKSCKVSVLIPAYQRPDDLAKTLAHTLEQDFDSFEIVVVDDGTPGPEIADAVAAFPGVRYLRRDGNYGLIAARNFGAAHCRGEYVVNLDDDSWLTERDGLSRLVAFMDAHPDVGIAALNIDQAGAGFYWEPGAAPFPIAHYVGCGNAYRRATIDRAGPYVEEFVRQGEELDRAMRVIELGATVTALPGVTVFHSASPINRNMRRNTAFEAANLLRRELIRAPLVLLPFAILRFLRFTIVNRSLIDFAVLRGELLGRRVPLGRFVRARRQPVRLRTYLECLRLRRLTVNAAHV